MKEQLHSVAPSRQQAPVSFAIKLGVPARELPALSCGCASENQLADWLKQYELHPFYPADQQRLVTLLAGLVEELAQWRAPAATRLPMLELLRQYAIACTQAIVTQRGVLSGTRQDRLLRSLQPVVDLLQQLYAAYAGLWLQLEDTGGIPFLVRERRARTLHRAIDATARLLRVCDKFGLSPPEHAWRRVHMLLRCGFPMRLAWRRVSDPMDSRGRVSAAGTYNQLALYFSAGPGQLDNRQQENLWQKCHDWGRQARLLPDFPDPVEGLLASAALDQAPLPAARLVESRVNMAQFAARGWSVELSGLLRRLEKQRVKRYDPLVERVCDLWSSPCGREEVRRPVQGECTIAIGLGATCFNLLGRNNAELGERVPRAAHADQRVCMEAETVDFCSGRVLRDYDTGMGVGLQRARSMGASPYDTDDIAPGHYMTETAQVCNRSEHGLGLRLSPAAGQRLRVGELLGVQLPDGWQVGVIRWHQKRADYGYAGVEILARHAVPVEVRRCNYNDRPSAPIPALLTREGEQQGMALILPVPLFRTDEEVELITASVTREVTLQRQTVATRSVARFDFV